MAGWFLARLGYAILVSVFAELETRVCGREKNVATSNIGFANKQLFNCCCEVESLF
jgi:hypothetical protein